MYLLLPVPLDFDVGIINKVITTSIVIRLLDNPAVRLIIHGITQQPTTVLLYFKLHTPSDFLPHPSANDLNC